MAAESDREFRIDEIPVKILADLATAVVPTADFLDLEFFSRCLYDEPTKTHVQATFI